MSIESLELNPAELKKLRDLMAKQVRALDRILRHPIDRQITPAPGEPLDFSQPVEIVSALPSLRAIKAKRGRVVGRAPGKGSWVYTVFIEGLDECWSLEREELKPISGPVSREAEGKRQHVRVRVDNQGHGHLVK